jgi:hypothetical protein
MNKSQQLRNRAIEVRALSELFQNQEVRHMNEGIAKEYDVLAEIWDELIKFKEQKE